MPTMNPSLREMQQELSVGEEFVTRYNRPGPRYTSYPTAPVWNDAYGPNDFETAMQAAEAKRSPVSLYMHLPFCESLCLFCACNVIIKKDKSVAPPYLNILKKEIDHIAGRMNVGSDHLDAFFRQALDHRVPDAARGAGDERPLPAQSVKRHRRRR